MGPPREHGTEGHGGPAPSHGLEGWREVPPERFGVEPAAHFVRHRAFVMWRAEEPFAGIFATAPQSIPDLEESWRGMERLCLARRAVSLFSDARQFGHLGATSFTLEHMSKHYPAFHRRMGAQEWFERVAIVTPGDFLFAWWTGAIAMRYAAGVPVRPFTDPDEGWRWLGAPPALRGRVAALTAAFDTQPLREAVRSLLLEDPLASPAATAKALGTSTRSLQRTLAEAGERFSDVRSRARLTRATELLLTTGQKLDAIASSIGFRSRAHFANWFREATGRTPTEFRKQAAPLTPR